MSLRAEIISDLQNTENDLGNPTFNWQGNDYNLIPSITDFNRELETGGFQLVRLMTATVRMYDGDDNGFGEVFDSNIIPQPQQKFIYNLDGTTFRVESIKRDPTNSYVRMTAHSITKGL